MASSQAGSLGGSTREFWEEESQRKLALARRRGSRMRCCTEQRTLLHYACAHGHPDVVTLLIAWNCDIDLRDSDNSTALIKAPQYEHEECTAILLEHGADPNAADSSGNTALHYAIWSKNTSMAAKLLAHHANARIRNKDGFTPLSLALMESSENLAEILVSQRAKIQEVDELDRKSTGSDSCGSSHLSKKVEGEFQELLQGSTEAVRSEEKTQGQSQRLDLENPKPTIKIEHEAEEAGQHQQTLAGTSWATEKAEKHKFNAEDALENLNHGAVALVLQRQDGKAEDQQIPVEENQENDGSVKKTSNVKNKDKEVSPVLDLNKLIPPSERNSEDCELLSFDSVLTLIEQLRRQSKDSDSLLIIWYTIHSFKRLMELKKHKFELLSEKNKKIKHHLSVLQTELSEAKQAKSQLELAKAHLMGELSNLRLLHENSNLRDTIRQQAEKIEQLQRKSFKNDEELENHVELNQFLKYRSEEEGESNERTKKLTRVKSILKMRRKDSNERENGKFSFPGDLNTSQIETDTEIDMLRQKIDCATARLEHALFNCERLENENQSLRQKLVAMTATQEKLEMLEDRENKFKQEILILKTHMQKNMISHSEAEIYKQEIEERSKEQLVGNLSGIYLYLKTQSAVYDQSEKRKENSLASARAEMEGRVKDMESELSRVKSQENSDKIELEIYKQSYQDQLKITVSLSEEINNISKMKEKLQKDNARLVVENELCRPSQASAGHATKQPAGANLRHRLEPNGNFTPSLSASVSHPQHCSMRACRPTSPSLW